MFKWQLTLAFCSQFHKIVLGKQLCEISFLKRKKKTEIHEFW